MKDFKPVVLEKEELENIDVIYNKNTNSYENNNNNNINISYLKKYSWKFRPVTIQKQKHWGLSARFTARISSKEKKLHYHFLDETPFITALT